MIVFRRRDLLILCTTFVLVSTLYCISTFVTLAKMSSWQSAHGECDYYEVASAFNLPETLMRVDELLDGVSIKKPKTCVFIRIQRPWVRLIPHNQDEKATTDYNSVYGGSLQAQDQGQTDDAFDFNDGKTYEDNLGSGDGFITSYDDTLFDQEYVTPYAEEVNDWLPTPPTPPTEAYVPEETETSTNMETSYTLPEENGSQMPTEFSEVHYDW